MNLLHLVWLTYNLITVQSSDKAQPTQTSTSNTVNPQTTVGSISSIMSTSVPQITTGTAQTNSSVAQSTTILAAQASTSSVPTASVTAHTTTSTTQTSIKSSISATSLTSQQPPTSISTSLSSQQQSAVSSSSSTSQQQLTSSSTPSTSLSAPITTASPQTQASSLPSPTNPPQTTPNPQENTTQNSDIPTRNPQSPSRPWDCSKFRITYLPQNCCSLPKLQISRQTVEKCQNECNNRHCCIVECKYREMGVYRNNEFNNQALLIAYKNSLSSDAEMQNWTNAMNMSLEFCESTVMSVTTLRTTTVNLRKSIVTMTTGRKASGGTVKGTEKMNSTKSIEATVTATSTASTASSASLRTTTSTTTLLTESLKDQRDRNLYCNIPVYVYLMISCTKVQNFINCPNFKANDDICDEWRDYLRKCRYELGFQV
ncbi:uncharacterized protein [Chironomus tepperi]|uniref:uncharacterized protein n=1 Tax=Chironomus tepperi TaxID=113505 RepID=UPI00391EF39C